MLSFLSWYLVVSFLGLLTFPLAFRLFPALADRGYSLARALGLLLWGYIFWLLASLGIVQNDLGGLLLALFILTGLSGWALWKMTRDQQIPDDQPSLITRQPPALSVAEGSLVTWLKSNLRLIFTIEFLFLLAFAVWAFVRAANPEITGTEKPMELAFINAILRSPTFPPRDPWLSGYAISYYYFGYVMTAMLAKLTGVLGSVAFNLMLALLFALSAVGAYGILYNLLAAWQRTTDDRQSKLVTDHWSLVTSFLGPLFLLLVSNFEGFLEILHQRGLFWPPDPQLATRNFWTWLDIKDLSLPPSQPLGWIPDRYLWWWRASRVVQDYDLAGNWREIIDEFPFFSYLLGDLHPHVLAMPFGLLAIGVALNLFLGGWRGETNLLGLCLPSRTGVLAARLHLRKCRRTVSINRSGFFLTAIVLGGLAFLNTWDILAYTALVLGAYVLARVRERGWSWERLEDFFALGLPLGLLALLLYLPFYFSFSSQAGGVLPNLIYPTRGAHLWVMFGALLVPIFVYLIYGSAVSYHYLWLGEKRRPDWMVGVFCALGIALFLWLLAWAMGWFVDLRLPEFAASFLQSQGSTAALTFFASANLKRLSYGGGLLTLLALLALAIAFLVKTNAKRLTTDEANFHQPSAIGHQPFVLLLILLGALLVLAPEFVYLRDQFGWRMNTIFKFYYQAWLLWSLAAAFGVAVTLTGLRRVWNWLYSIGLVILLFAALTYPTLSLLTKTNDFHPPFGWTLDGAAHLDREYSEDADAIRWLQTAPYGVIVEATTPTASYSDYAHISTYTGLPTVLGWPMHEGQWRGGYAEQGTRMDDIQRLYETNDWTVAQAILSQYHIHYVYVGTLERSAYRVSEAKFQRFLHPVYQNGNVTIYEVP
jgi:YYY domain-containing protein